MDKELSIGEITRTISQGDNSALKSLAGTLYKFPDVRALCAAEPSVWQNVIDRLATAHNSKNCESLQADLLRIANNLSATASAGTGSLISGFPKRLISLVWTNEQESRLKWQVLSNLSYGFKNDHLESIDDIISSIDDHSPQSIDPSVATPYMVFVANVGKLVDADSLWKLLNNQHLLQFILESSPRWFEGGSEFDRSISLSITILDVSIRKGLLSRICETYCNELEQQTTLYKLFDSILSSSKLAPSYLTASFWTSHTGTDISRLLRDETKAGIHRILPYIIKGNRSCDDAILTWNLNCSLLEILLVIFPFVPERTLGEYRHTLLDDFVSLLKACKSLPAKSKLKDAAQSSEPDPVDFPYLKSSVISVITSLVKNHHEAQDEVRISGGLAAVLESCIIDANNPYIKERAITCIRYLLDNNDENQKFVAAMEARQVVDPTDLAEAGFETEIVNGNIRIKRKD